MGGGGGWDYDYSEAALGRSGPEYAAEARAEGVAREYAGAETRGIPPPLGRRLSTASPTPLVVVVDVTGSMREWPKVIFDKLPVLYNEARLYAPEIEISFAAVGDANFDRFPLQVCDFRRGQELEEGINAILPEGGGGAGSRESYELAAWFYARRSDLPNASRSTFVYCGDEGFYETIKAGALTTLTGERFDRDEDARAVFAELESRYSVFNLRVPYHEPGKNAAIQAQWEEVLGADHVLELSDPRRIVDAIIGLVAIAAAEQGSFARRLALRQTAEQVESVMATLHPLLAGNPQP